MGELPLIHSGLPGELLLKQQQHSSNVSVVIQLMSQVHILYYRYLIPIKTKFNARWLTIKLQYIIVSRHQCIRYKTHLWDVRIFMCVLEKSLPT